MKSETWKMSRVPWMLVCICLVIALRVEALESMRVRAWCEGPYAGGPELSSIEIEKILKAHKLWFDSRHAEGEWANLCGADLRNIFLMKPDLRGMSLWWADLRGASLREADLRGVELINADLQGADLSGVKLDGADLQGANLTSVIFEPLPGSLPRISSLASVEGLSQLTYRQVPYALIELREALKKAGMRQPEREVTFALKREERRRAGTIESTFNLLLFELPCAYGLSPSRPLWLLIGFIPIFAVPYWIALKQANNRHGIWVILPADRLSRGRGKEKAVRLRPPTGKPWRKRLMAELWSLRTSLYFSLLSAFHLGWRELNVGSWIARLQTREYTLRARWLGQDCLGPPSADQRLPPGSGSPELLRASLRVSRLNSPLA